ncbi:4Fe-4S binding protein [Chloroflexota bacterium]
MINERFCTGCQLCKNVCP